MDIHLPPSIQSRPPINIGPSVSQNGPLFNLNGHESQSNGPQSLSFEQTQSRGNLPPQAETQQPSLAGPADRPALNLLRTPTRNPNRSAGDVLQDIGTMLADLTDELDTMLKLDKN